MAPLEQFILFGDSITQGFPDLTDGYSAGAALQSAFIRRLDVINRGFSGYNTDHALVTLPNVIPTPSQAKVRFLTIWFGANDLNADPSTAQHVPPAQFRQNLTTLLTAPLLTAQAPKTILITPPPVEESMLTTLLLPDAPSNVIRRARDAAAYRQIVRDVGAQHGVPVLDVWALFMAQAGWTEGSSAVLPGSLELGRSEALAALLCDGLHLTGAGYRLVYAALMTLIADTWPEENPVGMPFKRKVDWEIAMGDKFWDVHPWS